MKIFHIVSNKEWGGGEQYVYDLCQRQLSDGVDVKIFCKPINDIIKKYENAGIRVQALPLNGSIDVWSAWKIANAVRKAGTCFIHAHNFKDAFIAAYARKLSFNPLVRVVMCRHLTRKGKNSWQFQWLYSQIDCLCFVSQTSLDMFLSTNPKINREKLIVIHTSIVVPEVLDVVNLRQEYGIADDCTIAMYHGRLAKEKGLDTLIEAVKLLYNKKFRLILIGCGSDEYKQHLVRLINDYQISNKVIFGGFRHPVLPYVSSSDFGLLASIVQEGCPLSPQEYMSQGHPIIATSNGGQREYIEDGKNGLLVPPGDAQALAGAMERLIENIDLRKQLGRQAKIDYDDHLSYERFYAKMKKIYTLSL